MNRFFLKLTTEIRMDEFSGKRVELMTQKLIFLKQKWMRLMTWKTEISEKMMDEFSRILQ